MKSRIALLYVLFITVISQANAQTLFDKELFAIHPKLGMAYNIHQPDFKQFQGATDCGLFESGSGFGFSGTIAFEKAISPEYQISLGIGYVQRGGTLTLENIYPARDMQSNKLVDAKLENNLETKFSAIEIQPDFRWVVSPNLINGPFRLIAGVRFFLPGSGTFTQKEEIASPSNAVFVGNDGSKTRERIIAEGDIKTMNSNGFGISFGFDNMLKVSQTSFLTQELLFDYNLSDYASDASWKAMAVRFQVGIRFGVSEPEPEPIPVKEPEPVIQDVIVEEIKPLPILNLGIAQKDMRVNTGTELLSTAPLVNSVFFNQNESEIPASYIISKAEDVNYFDKDAIKLHKYILPRIAEIVENNKNSSLTIEGYTSGAEKESAGLQLAEARAESVKKALIALGVPEKKISTQSKLLPRIPSNADYSEGIAENQRVDIFLKNAPTQEYVDFRKFLELNGKIEALVDYSNTPETKGELKFGPNGKSIKIDKPGIYSDQVKMRLETTDASITYTSRIKIADMENVNFDTIKISNLPLINVMETLDNFEAVLRFDYNRSDLSEDNKGLLKQLSEKLKEGATILILGSADALGSEESNLKLSKDRASKTEEFIKSVSGNKFKIETGINTNKYPEDTPQGRFLNRSIRIIVK